MSHIGHKEIDWHKTMKASGWSIAALAVETEIREDTLKKILRKQIDPQPWHVRALARVLKISL